MSAQRRTPRPAPRSGCRITYRADDVAMPRLDRARVAAVVGAALAEAEAGSCALNVLFVSDARSAQLHGQHFADPTPTDVMTFPDGSRDPRDGRTLLGDLAVGVAVARREAISRGRPVGDELTLYILHGVLHLLGYDDRRSAAQRRMWAAQRRLLAAVGIALEVRPD
ncbi:MAG: rRNA maturation RNase YbeY [Planctomycetes bacterium]|nr:rRNA maturation RNase YbeY [Planctomycetota bacterium]